MYRIAIVIVLAIAIVYDTHRVVGIFVLTKMNVVITKVANPAIYAYVINL